MLTFGPHGSTEENDVIFPSLIYFTEETTPRWHNPEADAGRSQAEGLPGPQSEFKASLHYLVDCWCGSVIECSFSMYQALGSISSTTTTKAGVFPCRFPQGWAHRKCPCMLPSSLPSLLLSVLVERGMSGRKRNRKFTLPSICIESEVTKCHLSGWRCSLTISFISQEDASTW